MKILDGCNTLRDAHNLVGSTSVESISNAELLLKNLYTFTVGANAGKYTIFNALSVAESFLFFFKIQYSLGFYFYHYAR